MKYIIFDNKYPVLFPNRIIHSTVDIHGGVDGLMTPTSAGHYDNGKVHGVSESLGLKPKEGDLKLITDLLVLNFR